MARDRVTVDTNHLVSEYLSGRSFKDLEREFGVSRITLKARVVRAGIRPRTASEQEAIKWQGMGAAARAAQVAAAHSAVKGKPRSLEWKLDMALQTQGRGGLESRHERAVFKALQQRGIVAVPQLAIGPYNCDLACHPVAVEVWGGGWHFYGRHLAREPERIKHLGNAGWHVLILQITSFHPFRPEAADYIAAYINEARCNPSRAREYRVIDCRLKTLAAGRCDDDHIALVPPPNHGRDAATGRYKSASG